jgi:hypothetical protein
MKQIPYASIIAFLITLSIFTPKAHAYTMAISQKELQTMIEVWFPVKQATAIGDIKLSSPKILLPDNSGRINFAVNINLEIPGQYIAAGKGVIDGELDYNADRGEFYLREPRLLKLEVDGLPSSYDAIVLSVVNDLARQQLPLIVVYRLDKEEIVQASVLQTLKSVRVHKGQLLVELGLQ